MKYAYIARKRNGKVHETDASGRTYCQIENASARLTFVAEFPEGRDACWNCASVKAERLDRAMYEDFKRVTYEEGAA